MASGCGGCLVLIVAVFVCAGIFGRYVEVGHKDDMHRDQANPGAGIQYEALHKALDFQAKALTDQYPIHMDISQKAVDRKFEYVKEATTERQFTDRALQLQKMYGNRFAHAHPGKTDADVAELRKILDELNERLARAFAELVRNGQIAVETDEPKVADDAHPGAMSGATDSDKAEAWAIVQNFIQLQLKSPSTASFGGVFSSEFQDYDKCVRSVGGDQYVVTGWVDSQNGFGATVRTDFTVKLRYTGVEGEHWHLEGAPTLIQR